MRSAGSSHASSRPTWTRRLREQREQLGEQLPHERQRARVARFDRHRRAGDAVGIGETVRRDGQRPVALVGSHRFMWPRQFWFGTSSTWRSRQKASSSRISSALSGLAAAWTSGWFR